MIYVTESYPSSLRGIQEFRELGWALRFQWVAVPERCDQKTANGAGISIFWTLRSPMLLQPIAPSGRYDLNRRPFLRHYGGPSTSPRAITASPALTQPGDTLLDQAGARSASIRPCFARMVATTQCCVADGFVPEETNRFRGLNLKTRTQCLADIGCCHTLGIVQYAWPEARDGSSTGSETTRIAMAREMPAARGSTDRNPASGRPALHLPGRAPAE
jgi:hypothetical protein